MGPLKKQKSNILFHASLRLRPFQYPADWREVLRQNYQAWNQKNEPGNHGEQRAYDAQNNEQYPQTDPQPFSKHSYSYAYYYRRVQPQRVRATEGDELGLEY